MRFFLANMKRVFYIYTRNQKLKNFFLAIDCRKNGWVGVAVFRAARPHTLIVKPHKKEVNAANIRKI